MVHDIEQISGDQKWTSCSSKEEEIEMGRRLLRRDGRLVFRLIAYETSRGSGKGGLAGLIIPKETVPSHLPKTAISVLGTFFDAKTHRSIVDEACKYPSNSPMRTALLKSSNVVLKPDTVRKMVFG